MRHLFILVLSCFLVGCNSSRNERQIKILQLENEKLRLELLEMEAKADRLTIELEQLNNQDQQFYDSDGTEEMTLEELAVLEEGESWAKMTGTHNLSLQWIGWEKMGKCDFTMLTEGEFEVIGEQRNEAGDYVTINGTLTMQGNDHLVFNGIIRSKVSYINDGEECLRDGEYNFKAKGKRKYWRLQEMENCEGNNVVDYIDIYFK